MQKPFAGLLSDVLWYVHALDPIGVQKSDTTSEIFEKKRRITEWRASFFAAFQKFVFGAQDWTRTSMPLGAAT